jgi:hypothetical protein
MLATLQYLSSQTYGSRVIIARKEARKASQRNAVVRDFLACFFEMLVDRDATGAMQERTGLPVIVVYA